MKMEPEELAIKLLGVESVWEMKAHLYIDDDKDSTPYLEANYKQNDISKIKQVVWRHEGGEWIKQD
jgi:hypothetical protein